jgi:hypothetical protein
MSAQIISIAILATYSCPLSPRMMRCSKYHHEIMALIVEVM